mmetsp:Transcript_24184/g.52281  ORF Transcript_24184/g.52281 Transcript_24184/m.52281 type:complete len:1171 (+) Transcript_24184:150-3662(+)
MGTKESAPATAPDATGAATTTPTADPCRTNITDPSGGSMRSSGASITTDTTPANNIKNSNTTPKNNNNTPGGLLDYFVTRKRTSLENNAPPLNNNSDMGAVAGGPMNSNVPHQNELVRSSSRGSFYKSLGSLLSDLSYTDIVAVNDGGEKDSERSVRAAESSSSSSLPWMNQAMENLDSAREWMLATSSSNDVASNKNAPDSIIDNNENPQSNWMATIVPPSLSTALSNTYVSMSSLNPFSDNDATIQTNTQPNTNATAAKPLPKPSAFLPNFASRFKWTMKQYNPYQAVTGRNDDALLYYSPIRLFRLSTWWLPWITSYNHHHQYNPNHSLVTDGEAQGVSSGDGNSAKGSSGGGQRHKDTRGMMQQVVGRKKSQPSEASVRAVENLLLLVQQHLTDAAMQEAIHSEHSMISSHPEVQEDISDHTRLLSVDEQPHSSSAAQHEQMADEPSSPLATDINSMPPDMHTRTESTPNPQPSTPITSNVASPSFPNLSDEVPPARSFDSSNNGFVNLRHHRDRRNADDDCNGSNHQAMHAEMAARLAEGTLRAYRDLALDEATELHSLLHHWTVRWERPFLGWLEAGPDVWFSEEGYSPYSAGKKVSQIQAVLARRCAVIGEIQQHLWRANWQKGVAQWGMLGGGVGGEWTSVVGEFGGMDSSRPDGDSDSLPSSKLIKPRKRKNAQTESMRIFNHSTLVGTNVSNSPGGSIVVDQEALTTWSIDAIRVIRDQLYRAAGSGVRELPFVENWPREKRHFRDGGDGNGDAATAAFVNELDLPLWAREKSPSPSDVETSDASRRAAAAAATESVNVSPSSNISLSNIIISDLNNMSNEVSALLQSIEVHLEQQRARRLHRLRPRSRLRRNWYLFAIGMPIGTYALYKLTKEHGGFYLLQRCFSKMADIYRDHVSEPLESIYQEIFTKTGRIDVTDRKARTDTIESLKRMIRSWLEEYFPKMPLEEKIERAETMDISLIEERFEESIKHIYELNSVVRMSLIEMQFIKKELLSALVAMDELMGSNEINMQIAAMTPAVMLLMAIRKGFSFVFYAILQVGKSKDEIYASFRQTILDIERLLVMRDNPPSPPASFDHWGSTRPSTNNCNNSADETINTRQQFEKPNTILSAEDLGMLLLHIHECRNILWQSRRRFRSDVLRNVAEDLAELAGERGPVSVS